ncbi:hypothetical protein WBG78_20955 [Chryseolinea sp. T2]|uniref:hypothetical protein n=1 Tax=Chryseolinea sp. T2 TaxID=3129255 RepID=UPI0030773786
MQKRILSALLIVLVLLNTMGYYFIIAGFELRNDVSASNALDVDNYDVSSTVTLRIPIALPYQYDNADFMRVEGKFVHKGESYRLIKQKYANDTLTVICIKDEADQRIRKALADVAFSYVDSTSDTQGPSETQSLFIKEYLGGVRTLITVTTGWVMEFRFHPAGQSHEDISLPEIPHPPRA